MSRIRVTSRELARLLNGQEVEVVHRGDSLPAKLESHELVLSEPTDVRAQVVSGKLRKHARKVWNLTIRLDHAERPLLLNAESGGGVIVQLGEAHRPEEAAAHGYLEHPSAELADAGEAYLHKDVEGTAAAAAARARFALVNVNRLTKKRIRSLTNRAQDALMQAQAHGVDTEDAEASIDQVLQELRYAVDDVKDAA